VAAVATGLPDTYKDKQLKELVNDWQNQLKIDVAAFDKQATQVAGWWRELAQKESDIHVMVEELTVLDLKQKDVDRKLDEAEGFQTELDKKLGELEEEVKKLWKDKQGESAGNADYERENMYELAKQLQQELDVMLGQLSTHVDHLNSAHARHAGARREQSQVSKIMQVLNNHHQLLVYLENQSKLAERRVSEQEMDHARRAGGMYRR